MSSKKRVTIVIPNYNGKKLLEKNLPHVLKAYKYKRNLISEIIVVDDCSTDASVKLIKEKFPEIRLVKHTKNRGFSSAVNTGARTATSKLVALLNTDVVPSKDFLVSVLPHFNKASIFAVSLNEKGYSWAKGFFKNGFVGHEPGQKSKKIHTTFWVNGGSGVFRRSHWMQLGGMDEILFPPFYWEDIDLSYRAQKRGWKTLWEPKALVTHKHESTIGKISVKFRERVQERNQLLFIWKNITSLNLINKHKAGLFKKIVRHPGYLKIVFLAIMKLRWVRWARKKEKMECKVSDEAIFAQFS